MEAILAPNTYHHHYDNPDVFLAGGITDCPDWQAYATELFEDLPGVLLNPRREGAFKPEDAAEQIEWEYHALRSAETIFFWFPEETLCPITLFELGAFSRDLDVKLVVGTHPNYARRFDVIKQMELARPEVVVHDNIDDMVTECRRKMGYSN